MLSSRRASKAAAVLFGVYAVSQAYIAVLLRPVGGDALRVQTTRDPDELRRIMSAWSPEQCDRYRRHLLPDTLHPLVYASALAAAGVAGHRPDTPRWVRMGVVAAPVLSAGCDLAENALHARFIRHPDRITRRTARISTRLTRTKWVLAFGTAGALIARTVRNRRRYL